MRQFNTLTSFLLSKSSNPTINDTVTFQGYDAVGDGGNASWQFKGLTGQTPSQSPAQLGDALLNDGNGNQWELVATGRLNLSVIGVLDGLADNYLSIVAGVAFAKRVKIGFIDLPRGVINTSAEILITSEGTTLSGQGAGSMGDGITGYKTRLVGTSATKSVIRLAIEDCRVENLLIDASGDRLTAAMDSTATEFNCGIRVEGVDVAAPEGDVFSTKLNHVHVINQPNDGIVIVGRCYKTSVTNFNCESNKGHGLVVTNGEHTSRTNTTIAGIIDLTSGKCLKNEGHGFKIGANNSTDYTFRVTVKNCEGLRNCGPPALLIDAADSFIHCDGLIGLNFTATGKDKGGTPNGNAGITLMGLGGNLIDSRILSVTEPFRILKHPSRDSKGWVINNPHIRDSTAAYYVYLDMGVENIDIWIGDETGGIATATNILGITGLRYYYKGESFIKDKLEVRGGIYDDTGISLSNIKRNNAIVNATPLVILDASTTGKMWKVSLRHTGDPCLSSCTFEVVGGSAPVVSNISNQSGASVTFTPSVNGTDIELATSAGIRNSDIFIKELATA